jgi:tetratricopeptide (TPR) repeat protein
MSETCRSPRKPADLLRISALVALVTAASAGCKQEEEKLEPEAHQADPDARVAPEKPPLTDDQLVERYAKWADRLDTEPTYPTTGAFALAKADLQRVANEAADAHLRANAALLLGALHEARSERALAIDYYRHATKLVDDDAGPFMALAVVLAADKKYPEALEAQKQATKLDPDNLENWLALAELFVKSGDEESAKKTYVDYEVRRKGLIDGLTLKKGDAYRVAPPERIAIAEALASAADGGTGVALLYALHSDPDPRVRETVVRVMGVQRLSMYEQPLREHLQAEKDPKVQEAGKWALGEIARDPVEAKPPQVGGEPPPEVKQPGDGSPAQPDG